MYNNRHGEAFWKEKFISESPVYRLIIFHHGRAFKTAFWVNVSINSTIKSNGMPFIHK